MWVVDQEREVGCRQESIHCIKSEKQKTDGNKQVGCGTEVCFYAIPSWKRVMKCCVVYSIELAGIPHHLLAARDLRRADDQTPQRLTLAAACSLTPKRRVCFDFMPFCHALLYLPSSLGKNCMMQIRLRVTAEGYAMTCPCTSNPALLLVKLGRERLDASFAPRLAQDGKMLF